MATETPEQSSISTGLVISGYCIGFAIPLAIIYNLFYHKAGGLGSLFIIYVGAYLMGLLFTLLYYRSVVMHKSGDIAKMDNTTVTKIASVNTISFMIVAVTIFALAINPSLVNIFENTVGYLGLSMYGVAQLANEIFVSKELDEIQKAGDIDYSFLITRFGVNDIANINKYFESGCSQRSDEEPPFNLPTYFEMNLKDDGQLFRLIDLIYLKHTFGHFTWIYLTSIVSLLISMIALTMK